MPPLALTDEQMDRLLAAASMLPISSRDAFLKVGRGQGRGRALPRHGRDRKRDCIRAE